jgi:hypothetical protein
LSAVSCRNLFILFEIPNNNENTMSLIPETDARHLHTAAIHLYNAAIAEQERAETLTRPSYMLKPALSLDGNQWCALYGENLQDGVAGFGDTPALAYADFDKAWVTPARVKFPEGTPHRPGLVG